MKINCKLRLCYDYKDYWWNLLFTHYTVRRISQCARLCSHLLAWTRAGPLKSSLTNGFELQPTTVACIGIIYKSRAFLRKRIQQVVGNPMSRSKRRKMLRIIPCSMILTLQKIAWLKVKSAL